MGNWPLLAVCRSSLVCITSTIAGCQISDLGTLKLAGVLDDFQPWNSPRLRGLCGNNVVVGLDANNGPGAAGCLSSTSGLKMGRMGPNRVSSTHVKVSVKAENRVIFDHLEIGYCGR